MNGLLLRQPFPLIRKAEVQYKGIVAIMPDEKAPQYAQGRRLDLLTNAHLASLRAQGLREHTIVFGVCFQVFRLPLWPF